jgi:hypothetical protein
MKHFLVFERGWLGDRKSKVARWVSGTSVFHREVKIILKEYCEKTLA